MRIISGQWGGRRIQPPAHMPHTRPTTDIAKEGLFNILENQLDISSLKTLDLFGGTGCITYELASRGAEDLTIVEKDPKMQSFIQKTATSLGISSCRVIKMDVFSFIGTCTDKFDFIFAGPPYALATIDRLPELIFEKELLNPGGWFVLEHTPRNDYHTFAHFRAERKYGTTLFSVFTQK
jgi:16S rRNA (guanine966-N2)-methyltransferase